LKNKNNIIWVVIVCLVSFGSLAVVLLVGWSPKLGLDLEGGLSLTYQPKYISSNAKVSSADINTTINIIRNRIDALGVAQPNVDSQGGTIVVQIPGIKDVAKAEKLIGTTAQLAFRPVLCLVPPYKSLKNPKDNQMLTTPPPCTTQYTASTYQPPQNGSSVGNNYPPVTTNPLASYYPTNTDANTTPKSTIVTNFPGTSYRVELGPAVETGSAVSSASAVVANGNWEVDVTYTAAGGAIFDNFAQQQYHKLFAITLDSQAINLPLMNATNFGGHAAITGLTQTEAQNLAIELNYGSLPVSLVQLSAQSVTPTLGAASLRAGLLSGVVGLILVMLYTIFYYRGLGLVVVLGLATTGALLFALISWLGQVRGLTLDLSGVTGLIVSVGITVDSYVVYFERLKDEIRMGKSIRTSVDRGFKKAYRTVVVADLVSLIAAVCLYILSVGSVKGFAFFLGLSTILDLITAFAFTRPLVILLGRSKIFVTTPVIGIARGLQALTTE
jgi:preprotein translocase subunit SecD